MMTPTHSAVTYASLTRHGSAQLRSEHSTADRRASSGREQGGSRDTHAAGVVAQVVPIRATLHGYQHVENLLRQRTDESLAARHLDRPVQVWFLVHYMVFCHRVPVSPPRLPHPHPGVSFVDAGKLSGRDSSRFEVLRAARTPSRPRPLPPGDRCEKPIKRPHPQQLHWLLRETHREGLPSSGRSASYPGSTSRVRCTSADTPGDERGRDCSFRSAHGLV